MAKSPHAVPGLWSAPVTTTWLPPPPACKEMTAKERYDKFLDEKRQKEELSRLNGDSGPMSRAFMYTKKHKDFLCMVLRFRIDSLDASEGLPYEVTHHTMSFLYENPPIPFFSFFDRGNRACGHDLCVRKSDQDCCVCALGKAHGKGVLMFKTNGSATMKRITAATKSHRCAATSRNSGTPSKTLIDSNWHRYCPGCRTRLDKEHRPPE